MSSFDIGVMVRETSSILTNRLVDNIYQLDFKTLLISFRGIQERLLLEAGRRFHLTDYRLNIPKTPPAFCKALRKYLRRSKLLKIVQIDFDRIIKLVFSSREGEFSLYTEFFSRGNHILVDGERRILQALTYRRMRDRNVLRDETLILPLTRKSILDVKSSDLEDLISNDNDLARNLTKKFNVGGLYAEEIVLRSGMEKNKFHKALSCSDKEAVYNAIQSLITNFHHEEPHIVVNENGLPKDVLPFPLKMYEDMEKLSYPSFSKACDDYYTKLQTSGIVTEAESQLNSELDEQKRILSKQKAEEEKLKESIIINQKIGNLIYQHIQVFREIIDRLMEERRSGKPWNQIQEDLEENDLVVSVDPKHARANVMIDDLRFNLDLKKNVYQNASTFYERAKSLKDKLEGLKKAIGETQKRIEKAVSTGHKIVESEVQPIKIRKKSWYEKFHWFNSSEGCLVIGGKDSTTNEIIIKKYTDKRDIVFHADIVGSPFVVIKVGDGTPSKTTLEEAAQMVASYSRAWKMGVNTVDVYWIKPDQVSKTPPSGEYLPRGSFMIYGTRQYLRSVPLKLAIGIKYTSEGIVVIGGPSSAINSQTSLFVNIVPGRVKTGQLVKRLVTMLISKAPGDIKQEIRRLPLQEFQMFIPGGGGEISKD
jgi:predicted ribosome quality control (RQC) complex YloA/Tae2 family protein